MKEKQAGIRLELGAVVFDKVELCRACGGPLNRGGGNFRAGKDSKRGLLICASCLGADLATFEKKLAARAFALRLEADYLEAVRAGLGGQAGLDRLNREYLEAQGAAEETGETQSKTGE